jgi:hypothetical protein
MEASMADVIESCDLVEEMVMNIRITLSTVNPCAALTAASIALTCASLAACQSRSAPAQNETAIVALPGTTVNSVQGMEPAGPFDETPITPYETVGASMMN